MMRLDPKADPSWHAFRYLAGELTPDEEAAFERCLEWDQTAREALAEAVELVQAVHIVGRDARPVKPATLRTVRFRALGGLTVAAAACLAVVVGLQGPGGKPPTPPVPNQSDDGPNGAVALTWSGIRLDNGQDWRNDFLSWLDPSTSDEGGQPPEPESDGEPGLPSWMLEVASLQTPPVSRADGETKEN